MNPNLFIALRNLALIPALVAALVFLSVVLCREWVKGDLRHRVFRPIRVRWRPMASNRWQCGFTVVYEDFENRIHYATARTPWHRREVTWLGDLDTGSGPGRYP